MQTTLSVLAVEDSERDAELLALALEAGGYAPELVRVDTPEELSRLLEERSWDIIISDFSMPRFSGLDALAQVRTRDIDIPFLLISGTVGEELAVQAMKAGANDYLMKENLTRLVPAVERELREAEHRRLRRQAETDLRRSEIRYRQMFERNPAIKLLIDPVSRLIVDANPAACAYYGFTFSQITRMTLADINASPPQVLSDAVAQVLRDEHGSFNFRHVLASGEKRDVEVYSSLVEVEGRAFLFSIIHDITEQKRAETALRHQALHDDLTGLPNRTLLQDRLAQAIRQGERRRESVSLLLMDVDRFKEINDTFGHRAGDVLLQDLALRFQALLRGSDTVARPQTEARGGAAVARLGGDEFAILLPNADALTAPTVVERIVAEVSRPFLVEGQSLDLGVSIGIAVYPEHGNTTDLLLQHADVAMYTAKRDHTGHAVYEASQDPYTRSRIALIADLRRAIDDGHLQLHYQPKVDINTGRVLGAEALIRWPHAELGLIPAPQIIELAELTGMIKPLTLWVLRTAIGDCYSWREGGRNLSVAVNLSARSLHDLDLVPLVREVLDEAHVPCGALVLEITETAVMIDPGRAGAIIHQLDAMGVKVSIDDFGTGYSSLSYLRELPATELKIDKSFVLEMDDTHDDWRIVRAAITLAHDFGLTAVAEGIESQETWDKLESLSCDVGQGYFIARPMPPATFLEWLIEADANLTDRSKGSVPAGAETSRLQ